MRVLCEARNGGVAGRGERLVIGTDGLAGGEHGEKDCFAGCAGGSIECGGGVYRGEVLW